MFIVGVLALTSAMASAVWSTLQRRDNERELVFVGRQFQTAIEPDGFSCSEAIWDCKSGDLEPGVY